MRLSRSVSGPALQRTINRSTGNTYESTRHDANETVGAASSRLQRIGLRGELATLCVLSSPLVTRDSAPSTGEDFRAAAPPLLQL